MTVDELTQYGMEQMTDTEIEQLLSHQDFGILGLPADGPPSMRPLSFWYDGDETLYFVYVTGSESRKQQLSEAAAGARFLVYRIETTFNWRSALLSGTIEQIPASEREEIESRMEISWRPDVFERATQTEATTLFAFHIDEWSGIKQLELPPELRTESSGKKPRN